MTAALTRRGFCGLCLLAACGGDPAPEPAAETLRLALADYPALASPGGHAVVSEPGFEVHLIHRAEGGFVAIWRICSHGSCFVEVRSGVDGVECPCHGSRFGLDGAVERGPATRPLRVYAVTQEGESLLLRRG